jgi:hypothetical protein
MRALTEADASFIRASVVLSAAMGVLELAVSGADRLNSAGITRTTGPPLMLCVVDRALRVIVVVVAITSSIPVSRVIGAVP